MQLVEEVGSQMSSQGSSVSILKSMGSVTVPAFATSENTAAVLPGTAINCVKLSTPFLILFLASMTPIMHHLFTS